MAKNSDYKYPTSQNCAKALARERAKDLKKNPKQPDVIRKPNILAKLFYQTFLERNGIMYADQVYNLGLCDDKTSNVKNKVIFKTWRKILEVKGWIIHDQQTQADYSARYIAGEKLERYLEKERILQASVREKQTTDKSSQRPLFTAEQELDSMPSFELLKAQEIEEGNDPTEISCEFAHLDKKSLIMELQKRNEEIRKKDTLVEDTRAEMADLKINMQRLIDSNQELRDSNQQLADSFSNFQESVKAALHKTSKEEIKSHLKLIVDNSN